MQTIQAQYQRRRGETVDPALLGGSQQTLRQELGDADYERYLTALGRPTKVGVFNVIASSPAEQAGLRAGDEILSYGGTRVFDMSELNDLTVEGTPGQPVVLEVQRDGQNAPARAAARPDRHRRRAVQPPALRQRRRRLRAANKRPPHGRPKAGWLQETWRHPRADAFNLRVGSMNFR